MRRSSPVRRGFRWGTLFWSAVGGLVLLGLGLGVANLIEDLFARSQTLGYRRAGLRRRSPALALAVVIAREALGLVRLAAIEKLHQRAAKSLVSDDRADEPRRRQRPARARASEPATGARPRRAAEPSPTTSSTAPT